MSRTLIVEPGSAVLADPSTHPLFYYADGKVLVETDGAVAEDPRPGQQVVEVSGGLAVDLPEERVSEARRSLESATATIAAWVELAGPADAAMLSQLREAGVSPQQAVPVHAYLCTGTADAFRAVRSLPFVRAVTPVSQSLKQQAATSEDENARTDVDVVGLASLIDGAGLTALVKGTPGARVSGDPETVGTLVRLAASVNGSAQEVLLADPRVFAVEARAARRAEDEVADLILVGNVDSAGAPQGSFVTWLDDHGINGSGVTIGIVDQGVDVTHPAFTGRITDLNSGAKDWHGTFVAGHAAGAYLDDRDPRGFIYGIGMAPNGALLSQDNKKTASSLCAETVSSGGSGAVQNNSWGAGTHDPMDYTSQEATFDALVRNAASSGGPMPLTICFSAGNDGTAGLTRPKAAKNLIVTGNSENYRPDAGGAEADDIRQIYAGAHASSHGNCGDGRIRPHVVAPGEWTASANYDSHPGEKEYVDDKITWGGGTSGASPKTAGSCALMTEWWRHHTSGSTPSPAMLRALVVNGAEPIDAGGPIPNNVQGWGRLNVDAVMRDDVHRSYVDQTAMLTSRGDFRTWTIRPSDPTKPLWVTLAWTDPPGAPGTGTATAPAVVNQLALRINSNGSLYRGNQFANGWSTPDTGTDREGWDNTQCVYLRPQDLGDTVEVSVTALDLAMDCLTGQAGTPQQDFALVVRGGFVDRGATPADVFLILDPAAASPGDPGYQWSPGNSDHGVVSDPVPAKPAAGSDESASGAADGGAPNGSTSNGGTPGGTSGGESTDDSGWWNDAGSPSTETQRTPRPLATAVAAGAAAGAGLVTASGSMTMTAHAAGPGAGDPTAPVADLSAALAALDGRWHDHDPRRRRTAVLVVGDLTRVSNADVAVLRRVSFLGELWVLSTTPSILQVLAQREHRRTRVHYQLCTDAADLARAVRDALAEAAGLQQLVTRRRASADGTVTVDVDVVPDDVALVVRLDGPGAAAARLTVKDPSARPAVGGTVASPPSGVPMSASGGGLDVSIAVRPDTAGIWTLTASPGDHGSPLGVAVYARSRLGLATSARPTDRGPLLAVHGRSATLSQLQLESPRVAGDVPAGRGAEASRGITVTSTTSRIDAGGRAGEAPREALTPSLGAVVPVAAARRGARIIDLPGNAHGASASGHRYARVIRPGVVDLEPRSVWRASLPARPVVLTSATVRLVERDSSGVHALTLSRGALSRRVVVRSAGLAQALADADLTMPHLLFRVRDDELLGVIETFDGAPPVPAPRDGGGLMSLAGLEPAPATVEDAKSPDYSGASRYVQAKFFRGMPAARTVNRVVIHITDGQPKVDGTIAWFQDPKKNDGSPLPVSAHYIVGRDGEVVQMVRENDVAFHASSANGDSIGIEHCARSPRTFSATDPGMKPTEVQYAASAALVKDICQRQGIAVDRAHVLGHNEADPTTTHSGCPTNAWDWDYYVKLLTSAGPSDDSTGNGAGTTDDGTSDTTGTTDTGTDDTTDTGTDDTTDTGTDDTTDTGTDGTTDTGTDDTTDTGTSTSDDGSSDTSGDDTGAADTGSTDTGSADTGAGSGSEASSVETARDAISPELARTSIETAILARPSPPVFVPSRPVLRYRDGGGGDPTGDLPPRRQIVLRPAWIVGRVWYLPIVPPTLGDPITVAAFALFPDPSRGQVFFQLVAPKLRLVSLVVNRSNVAVQGGGTTTKIVGGTAVLTVSAFADSDPATNDALRSSWVSVLTAHGIAGADAWRFLPLSLRNISGSLQLPDGDVSGVITAAGSPDAGTLTFSVPLSESGAIAWSDAFGSSRGSSLAGTCTVTATMVAQLGTAVDARDRTLTVALGDLLASVGPASMTVVDPQTTVAARVIVTANDLVDSVTVDVVPSKGAPAASLAFTKEGGQTQLPVTAADIRQVQVAYTSTVRYTPPGWPVVTQRGTLRFADADWDLWVKPDSWLAQYDLVLMLLDAQNRVLSPGTSPTDVMTLRIDYSHPEIPESLTLTVQSDSQQLLHVPFPNPPGAPTSPTVSVSVLGTRAGTPAGPTSRVLTPDETMVVAKVYANGVISIVTNKDHTAEDSVESDALGVLARLRP
jgi:N-acetyl-anhydromuramyl-L-alanine amidase AmpD